MDDIDENESSEHGRHNNLSRAIMSTSNPNIPAISPSVSLNCQMDTPSLDEKERALLRQRHSLHISDSGFSEWSPTSTSVESLDQTPSMQELSSLQCSTHASPSIVEPISHQFLRSHRRSWPLKSRKLSFLSLDGPVTPVLDITSQHKEEYRTGCEDSDPSLSEELGKFMPKSELCGVGKGSLLSQALHRSRSSSRSPSSITSDSLEGSFQEMSLEENSSDSSQDSPKSPPSSSPVFTFMLHVNSKSTMEESRETEHIRLPQLSTESLSSPVVSNNCIERVDQSTECLSSLLSPVIDQTQCSSQEVNTLKEKLPLDVSQADFAACLSLAPVQSHCVQLSSSSDHHVFHPHSSQLHCCADCHYNSLECSNNTHAQPGDFDLVKSPSKRNASNSVTCNLESVSPSKMPRLKRTPVAESKSKRDLFGSEESISKLENNSGDTSLAKQVEGKGPCANTVESDRRVPQFLCIGCDVDKPNVPYSKLTAGRFSNEVRLKPSNCGSEGLLDSREQNTSELIDKVCSLFSPPNIAKLIGRRFGVKKLDIISELQQQNLIGCVALILSHIPDSDLMKLAEVSDVWKQAILEETKASRRYKALVRKLTSPRKNKSSPNKENVADKSSRSGPTLMTSSKGHLTAIQAQTVVRNGVVPRNLSVQSHDLHFEDKVRNCPLCQSRAVIFPSQDRAICMSEKCGYDFCTKCFFQFHHPSPCKPLFQLASRTTLAGTKKSKKNLKRLKNL